MGKGDEAGGDFLRRGSKKTRKQKTFQNRENKNEGGETPLLSVLGSLFCHALGGESKERGDQEIVQTGI